MSKDCARYEAVAWWFTRRKIGQSLRELYEDSKEFPPKLGALVRQLGAMEGNHLLSEFSKQREEADPQIGAATTS
jgi:hypothetical protein